MFICSPLRTPKTPFSRKSSSRLSLPRARCTLRLQVGHPQPQETGYLSVVLLQRIGWIRETMHSGRSYPALRPPRSLSRTCCKGTMPSWIVPPLRIALPMQLQMLALRLHGISLSACQPVARWLCAPLGPWCLWLCTLASSSPAYIWPS